MAKVKANFEIISISLFVNSLSVSNDIYLIASISFISILLTIVSNFLDAIVISEIANLSEKLKKTLLCPGFCNGSSWD